MARIPPIDLSGLTKLLKQEGKTELSAACFGKGQQSFKILLEWDNIIRVLELEIIPFLAKGGEVAHLAAPAKKLAKSAGALASVASQVLSFVPGPIGIVCSVINAIVCFCTLPFPVNIGNGMLELLGCIPGGKVAAKGGAKLAVIKKTNKSVNKITKKHPTKNHPTKNNVGFYRELNNYNARVMPSLEESILMNSKKPSMIKTGTPRTPELSTNKMEYILRTKTGKSDPFSHLY